MGGKDRLAMISETLADGLARYGIGQKIRSLRKGKRLGLVQLGEHTGLSPGLLSKIERGQLFPTLPTLLRIALVFGVGLEHFFRAEEEQPMLAVVRKAERLRLPDQAGAKLPSYFFESLNFRATDRKLDAFLADFPAGGNASAPHAHAGAEFLYVITGGVELQIGGQAIGLEEGDAVYFDAAREHCYAAKANADGSAIALVVVHGASEA